jgi:predicted ATPase
MNANAEAAEACFKKALATARRLEARSLELRAALSLARLYRDGGRHALARDLILPIYEQFDEGFGTADLRETRDLLDLHSTVK